MLCDHAATHDQLRSPCWTVPNPDAGHFIGCATSPESSPIGRARRFDANPATLPRGYDGPATLIGGIGPAPHLCFHRAAWHAFALGKCRTFVRRRPRSKPLALQHACRTCSKSKRGGGRHIWICIMHVTM